jgi:hypothetical protein
VQAEKKRATGKKKRAADDDDDEWLPYNADRETPPTPSTDQPALQDALSDKKQAMMKKAATITEQALTVHVLFDASASLAPDVRSQTMMRMQDAVAQAMKARSEAAQGPTCLFLASEVNVGGGPAPLGTAATVSIVCGSLANIADAAARAARFHDLVMAALPSEVVMIVVAVPRAHLPGGHGSAPAFATLFRVFARVAATYVTQLPGRSIDSAMRQSLQVSRNVMVRDAGMACLLCLGPGGVAQYMPGSGTSRLHPAWPKDAARLCEPPPCDPPVGTPSPVLNTMHEQDNQESASFPDGGALAPATDDTKAAQDDALAEQDVEPQAVAVSAVSTARADDAGRQCSSPSAQRYL